MERVKSRSAGPAPDMVAGHGAQHSYPQLARNQQERATDVCGGNKEEDLRNGRCQDLGMGRRCWQEGCGEDGEPHQHSAQGCGLFDLPATTSMGWLRWDRAPITITSFKRWYGRNPSQHSCPRGEAGLPGESGLTSRAASNPTTRCLVRSYQSRLGIFIFFPHRDTSTFKIILPESFSE